MIRSHSEIAEIPTINKIKENDKRNLSYHSLMRLLIYTNVDSIMC